MAITVDLNHEIRELHGILNMESDKTKFSVTLFEALGRAILQGMEEERLSIIEAVNLTCSLFTAMSEKENALANLVNAFATKQQQLLERL